MGSALFGWAFTLTRFAQIYCTKFGIEREKMTKKLWGDNYFDGKGKKWKHEQKADDGGDLKRAFVQFIMDPIIRLCKASMNGEMEKVDKMLKTLEIKLKEEERQLQGKHLMKNIF